MNKHTLFNTLLNEITSSNSSWPSQNVGVMVSFDYTTTTMASYGYADPVAGTIFQSGSGESETVNPPPIRPIEDHEHKLYEMNSNPYHWINSASFYGFYDRITTYVSESNYDNVVLLKHVQPKGQNPKEEAVTLFSQSLATKDISLEEVNYLHFADTHLIASNSGSFYVFQESPYKTASGLTHIVSGSFEKTEFRRILASSSVSSSLIPLWDSDNPTTNAWGPDYVIKNNSTDNSLAIGGQLIKSYRHTGSNAVVDTYASYTGSQYLIEEFVLPEFVSASLASASSAAFVDKLDIPYGTATYLTTPTKNILLRDDWSGGLGLARTNRVKMSSDGSTWKQISTHLSRVVPSGSLVKTPSGTKAIMNVNIGDTVSSYLPVSHSTEDFGYLDYSTNTLSGSTSGTSEVVNITYGREFTYTQIYYEVGGDEIMVRVSTEHANLFIKDVDTGLWGWKTPPFLKVGDKMLNTNEQELEITRMLESVTVNEEYYALDVEDTDTYFVDGILIHNGNRKGTGSDGAYTLNYKGTGWSGTIQHRVYSRDASWGARQIWASEGGSFWNVPNNTWRTYSTTYTATNDGTGQGFASTVDGGSYDNCVVYSYHGSGYVDGSWSWSGTIAYTNNWGPATYTAYFGHYTGTGTSTLTTTFSSDYRAKTDMDWIGKSKSGLNIYEFSYNWDKDTRYQGVVAQELLNTKYEDSVVQMTDGYLGVDYSQLDVDFKQVT